MLHFTFHSFFTNSLLIVKVIPVLKFKACMGDKETRLRTIRRLLYPGFCQDFKTVGIWYSFSLLQATLFVIFSGV